MPRSSRACLAVVILLAAACHGPRPAGPPSTATAAWDPVTRLLVDSAGARMATLELRRLALRSAGVVRTEPALTVAGEIDALTRQLSEIPHADVASRLVGRQVLSALDAREAGLILERQRLLVHYTAASVPVQQLDMEAQALAQRRAELQATLVSSRGTR